MREKTVLITGGARGIGAAAVRRFHQAGYRVMFCYRSAEAAAAVLERECPGVRGIRCDVSDPAAVERLFATLEATFDGLDALVLNAGISKVGLLTDLSLADWEEIFATNVRSLYLCCHAALPQMVRQQRGSIVTVSSMWGEVGGSCEVAYSASKGAVIAFTKALAKEVGPSHIRVNSVSPGTIATDMVKSFPPETLDLLKEETPLDRLGDPKDVAEAIFWLCEEGSSFITGQVLGVNGGMII